MLKLLFSLIPSSPIKLYGALGGVILIGLIAGIHLLGDKSVRKERDVAVNALNDYITATNAAAAQRDKENAIKEALAKSKVDEITQERQSALNALAEENVTHEQSKQQIRELVDALKFNQKRIIDINRNWADRVRAEAINSATGLSEAAADSEKPTSIGRECDATAFRNVIDACKLTTIDFNTCRQLLDADALVCERAE